MSKTIPQVRSEMEQYAALIRAGKATVTPSFFADRLDIWVEDLKRRSPVRRAKPTSTPTDETLNAAMRAYAAAYPEASLTAIGAVFNVNGGRVSEALRGKRGEA